MTQIGRLVTALVSPFTDEGTAIDESRLERLIAHVIAGGTETLLIGGTTGEGPTLTDDEFELLIRRNRAIAPEAIGIMANVGTNNTVTSIARARMAEEVGADSLLVVCPYYNKPPQAGLIAHFSAVAAATDLPIIIYNIPGRTSVNMLPETVATIMNRCPTIVGIKEASGNLDQMRRVIELVDRPRFLWSGDDGLLADVIEMGGVGVVSVVSHIVGPQIRTIIEAGEQGDHIEARRIQRELEPLIATAFCTTNPIPIKAMLNALGVAVGPCRLPLVPAEPAEQQQILAAVERLQGARV